MKGKNALLLGFLLAASLFLLTGSTNKNFVTVNQLQDYVTVEQAKNFVTVDQLQDLRTTMRWSNHSVAVAGIKAMANAGCSQEDIDKYAKEATITGWYSSNSQTACIIGNQQQNNGYVFVKDGAISTAGQMWEDPLGEIKFSPSKLQISDGYVTLPEPYAQTFRAGDCMCLAVDDDNVPNIAFGNIYYSSK